MLNNHPTKVKVLKKVRRRFLNKTPAEDEEHAVVPFNVDPDTQYIVNVNGYAIKASIGLVEIGRKVCIGPEYLNRYFNVESTVVEDRSQNKVVTLNLCPNENQPVVPWQYAAKRLESYGNLDLAMWAHRIKDHYLNYDKAVTSIHDLVTSDNPEIQALLRNLRKRAAIARREIESTCAYNGYVQFFKKDTNQPLSACFNEKFLKRLGYTAESFMKWSKENGLPQVLAHNSDVYENIIKEFLKSIPMLSETIKEAVETENVVYTKDGKMKAMVRFVNILEPTPEGMFFYCYIILCDDEVEKEISKKKMICNGDDDEEDFDKENTSDEEI